MKAVGIDIGTTSVCGILINTAKEGCIEKYITNKQQYIYCDFAD